MKFNLNSLAARISLMVFALTLFAAGLMMAGLRSWFQFLYALENRQRAMFLAETLAAGIGNYLVLGDPAEDLGPLTRSVLEREGHLDDSLAYCRIYDARNRLAFALNRGERPWGDDVAEIRHEVKREDLVIGRVELGYRLQDALTFERIRQVRSISDTLAAVAAHYFGKGAYFQISALFADSLNQDPNILYAAFAVDGETIAQAHYDEFLALFPDRLKAIEGAAAGEGVGIERLGKLGKYGEAVEVRYPLALEGGLRGEMRLGYSMASLEETFARTRFMFAGVFAALGLAALGVSLFAARRFVRPALHLAQAARELTREALAPYEDYRKAEKELNEIALKFESLARKERARKDEIGQLARSIEQLMRGLQDRVGQLRRIYQSMSQADRLSALGQLSAGIAHEINNPLSIMSTTLQVALKRGAADPETLRDLEGMMEEIGRIDGKVKALLSFAREGRGEFQPLDLNDLVEKTLDLTRHPLNKSGIEAVRDLSGELPYLEADEQRLKQALLNLIINAIHAMPRGGTLTASTRLEAGGREGTGWAAVSIQDTGPGIPEDIIDKVFDPFFTTKDVSEGTGLGLAIVYGIVQAHGGRIEVDSKPGQGAKFTVFLPLTRSEPT